MQNEELPGFKKGVRASSMFRSVLVAGILVSGVLNQLAVGQPKTPPGELVQYVRDARKAGLLGTKDPILLELAANQERILISHDRRTMTRYFRERLEAEKSNTGSSFPSGPRLVRSPSRFC